MEWSPPPSALQRPGVSVNMSTLCPCPQWRDGVWLGGERGRRWPGLECCLCSRWSSLLSLVQQTLRRGPVSTAQGPSWGGCIGGVRNE